MQRGRLQYKGGGPAAARAARGRVRNRGASSEGAPAARGAVPPCVARAPYWRATNVSSEASGGHAKRTGV